MIAVNVTTVAATVVNPGFCDFIHIYNNSDVTIYISYDGTAATTAAGMPILAGQTYQLNNDGSKQIFVKGVSAIHASSGSKEIRIQQG